jgi:hypothetical protein
MKSLIQIFICLSLLATSCKVYQPIDKVVKLNDSADSNPNRLQEQLSNLSKNDKLKINLKSGREVFLRYESMRQDTLVATYMDSRWDNIIQIPLGHIESVQVQSPNLPLTLVVGSLTGLVIYFAFFYSLGTFYWIPYGM